MGEFLCDVEFPMSVHRTRGASTHPGVSIAANSALRKLTPVEHKDYIELAEEREDLTRRGGREKYVLFTVDIDIIQRALARSGSSVNLGTLQLICDFSPHRLELGPYHPLTQDPRGWRQGSRSYQISCKMETRQPSASLQ